MENFYIDTLRRLLMEGELSREMSVLVTCSGPVDRDALVAAGFTNVLMTSLDRHMTDHPEWAAPFPWKLRDAESLDFPDNSFDLALAHSGLHHCRSPHRALLEMYRVARKAVLIFEPHDGLLVRLGVRTGLGQEYEHGSVVTNAMTSGGVADTTVPNYVFRWTPHDVERTIKSFAPHLVHRFRYFYALRVPTARLRQLRSPFWSRVAPLLATAMGNAASRVPGLANNIAFLIVKPEPTSALQPWLRISPAGEIEFDSDWAGRYYSIPRPEERGLAGKDQ